MMRTILHLVQLACVKTQEIIEAARASRLGEQILRNSKQNQAYGQVHYVTRGQLHSSS